MGTRRAVRAAIALPLLFLSLVYIPAACSDRPSGGTLPVVVVSVLPQRYFVEQVAGPLVEVEVLLPPGASPATYEPTVRQMAALRRASLLVKVGHPGFPFERAWLDHLLGDHPGLAVVDASADLDRSSGDPHVWVSPSCARAMARRIAHALAELLPDDRASLLANRDRFLAEIDALDRELRGILEPYRGRRFLVFHPAWGHFAAEYGLEQVSIEHDEKEPGPGELAHLIELARAEKVSVIFVQPQFDRSSAELIAREVGATVVTVDPLAPDWADNLRAVARAFRDGFER